MRGGFRCHRSVTLLCRAVALSDGCVPMTFSRGHGQTFVELAMRRADHPLPEWVDRTDVPAGPIADRHAPDRRCVLQRRVALAHAILVAFSASAAAQQPSANETGFNVVGRTFVAIQVRDEAAAAEWYTGVFGLEEVNRLESADGRYSIRILSGGGLSLELIRHEGAGPRRPEAPLGLFKTGFYVDDIEAALAWLRGRGVDTDRTVLTDRALQARTFTFRDVEGNRWQAFEACGGDCGS